MKPQAVIVDVDGTLADVRPYRHYVLRPASQKDFDSFHREALNAKPHNQAITYCTEANRFGFDILVLTGRMEMWREGTQEWIDKHVPVPTAGLWMRADGDRRPDYVVKRKMYEELSQQWEILHAIDDNPSIIQLWNNLGIPVEVVPGWSEEAAAAYVRAQNNHGAQP